VEKKRGRRGECNAFEGVRMLTTGKKGEGKRGSLATAEKELTAVHSTLECIIPRRGGPRETTDDDKGEEQKGRGKRRRGEKRDVLCLARGGHRSHVARLQSVKKREKGSQVEKIESPTATHKGESKKGS